MTKFISDKQEHQNKAKTRRKTKVKFIKFGNKDWISVSASLPRISSNQQGLLLAVYLIDLFNGVATWKKNTQS